MCVPSRYAVSLLCQVPANCQKQPAGIIKQEQALYKKMVQAAWNYTGDRYVTFSIVRGSLFPKVISPLCAWSTVQR